MEIHIDPGLGEDGKNLIDTADSASSQAADDGRHTLLLEAYGYR
jgi:maltose alpha-D-glucosyltransferase/alpha-amylase